MHSTTWCLRTWAHGEGREKRGMGEKVELWHCRVVLGSDLGVILLGCHYCMPVWRAGRVVVGSNYRDKARRYGIIRGVLESRLVGTQFDRGEGVVPPGRVRLAPGPSPSSGLGAGIRRRGRLGMLVSCLFMSKSEAHHPRKGGGLTPPAPPLPPPFRGLLRE